MSAPTQYFLIRVQRMCTSDECDLVSGWSAIVAEENLGNPILSLAAEATALSIKDCPVAGIRPMTEAEIAEWRHAEDEA